MIGLTSSPSTGQAAAGKRLIATSDLPNEPERVCMRRRSSWLLVILALVACQSQQASPEQNRSRSSSSSSGSESVTGIDAGRAFGHMKNLVGLGPRPSGSDAIKKTQQYISNELKSYGLKLIEDPFVADTPRGKLPMTNLIGELPGNRPDIVILAGHYDTKLLKGFVGANDGGSSTAGVLEMARALSKSRFENTLWFVFFDGEEAVVDWYANEGRDNTYGSRHLAAKLAADGSIKNIRAMVLVDMIGDKDLGLKRDAASTQWLLDLIWQKARELGHGRHFLGNESAYSDDHIPFKELGVAAIDLIDFDYGPDNAYWHTPEDTLDKVSGESVKVVCDVVIRSLPEIIKQANERAAGPPRRNPQ